MVQTYGEENGGSNLIEVSRKEFLPRRLLFSFGCRIDAAAFENLGDLVGRKIVPKVCQSTQVRS
jgi:hypothetical protein